MKPRLLDLFCGAPAPYGGLTAARKHSRSDLQWMGHCNRRVRNQGQRCWQHREQPS